MLSITTNTAALSAQRNLESNGTQASNSIARMSSGSRIVKPSDDAASLAISNKLGASIAALEQAGRNASQGSSLLQVANGAYDNIGDMLSRMKVLSTQVVNGALSTTERLYAQEEFDSLREQITATAEQTSFGSVSLLNGGGGDYLQRGTVAADAAGSSSNISDLTDNVAALDAGNNDFFDDSIANVADITGARGFVDGAVGSINVEIAGQAFQVSMQIGNQNFVGRIDAANGAADGLVTFTSTSNAANSVTYQIGTAVTDFTESGRQTLENGMRTTFNGTTYTSVNADPTAEVAGFTGSGGTLGVDQNGTTTPVKAGAATEAGTYRFQYISTGDETADDATGYVATGDDRSGTGYFELTDGSKTWTVNQEEMQLVGEEGIAGSYGTVTFGNGMQVYLNTGDAGTFFDRGTSSATASHFDVGAGGGISLNFQIAENSADQVSINFASATATALGLDGLSVADEASAAVTSDRIDTAINVVNTAQASLGALQSRFEYIESTIATTVENVSAARGTFADVDMAAEMTDFTKSQTLMQASVAMLSQANQMPQQLLRLLQ